MATAVATLLSERWLDQVVIQAAYTIGSGAINDQISLPQGIGDLGIIEINVTIGGMGTPVTLTGDDAVQVTVGVGTSTVDIVGIERWYKVSTAFGAYFSPDPIVLWRQNEILNVLFGDLDTTGTGTLSVLAKCVRIRPVAEPEGPVQLVR